MDNGLIETKDLVVSQCYKVYDADEFTDGTVIIPIRKTNGNVLAANFKHSFETTEIYYNIDIDNELAYTLYFQFDKQDQVERRKRIRQLFKEIFQGKKIILS